MALNHEELRLVEAVGFDARICELVKSLCDKPLERLKKFPWEHDVQPAEGLSLQVEGGDEAERLMNRLSPELSGSGYRVFWSQRINSDSVPIDELAILKTADADAMVRLRESNGANYGITTDDILDRLTAWRKISAFDVVGASVDWVALKFSRLPESVCSFAAEVYLFCPDAVEQGVGLCKEKDDPKRFVAAKRLCPELPSTVANRNEEAARRAEAFIATQSPELLGQHQSLLEAMQRSSGDFPNSEMGVRLLAYELHTNHFLFLWWD